MCGRHHMGPQLRHLSESSAPHSCLRGYMPQLDDCSDFTCSHGGVRRHLSALATKYNDEVCYCSPGSPSRHIFDSEAQADLSSTAGLFKTLRPTKRFLLQVDGLEEASSKVDTKRTYPGLEPNYG